MGMKPKGRKHCVEFRVYVDQKLKTDFLASIAHWGACRHTVFEALMAEWIDHVRDEIIAKHDREMGRGEGQGAQGEVIEWQARG